MPGVWLKSVRRRRSCTSVTLPSGPNKYKLLQKYRRAVLDAVWQEQSPMSREARKWRTLHPETDQR